MTMLDHPCGAGLCLALGITLAAFLLTADSGGAGAALGSVLLGAIGGGLVLGLAMLALWREHGGRGKQTARPPEAVLDERFARGELTRQQYNEALLELLKGRYVRGELELDAYEARLDQLLGGPSAHTLASRPTREEREDP